MTDAEKNLLANTDMRGMLRDLAMQDFDKFMELIKVDSVQIFICVEKSRSKSLQQMVNKLHAKGISVTRSTVQRRCRKCI